ncbi:MAG: hypothetical protein JSV58_01750, partial [Candidatus Bathyarchaeota archaeon]
QLKTYTTQETLPETYYSNLTRSPALHAVITVIPTAANRPHLPGYYAHCSFSPASTLVCLVIAGIVYWFGNRR